MNAEGIYYRFGLTSAPAVKKVVSSDINGDGASEVVHISQTDHTIDFLKDDPEPADLDDWAKGAPEPDDEAGVRPQQKLRTTTVTDSMGTTKYEFGDGLVVSYANQEEPDPSEDLDTEIIKVQPQMEGMADNSYGATIIARRLTVTREAPGAAAAETFYFRPDAGMALAAAIDASGNETRYTYKDEIPLPDEEGGPVLTISGRKLPDDVHRLQILHADPNGRSKRVGNYSDGEPQDPATQSYEYQGEWRLQTRVVDENKNVTVQQLEDGAPGLREWEKVFKPVDPEHPENLEGATLLRWEAFAYDNADFPMFMTKHTIRALDRPDDPTWVEDMVTVYVPDTKGRVAEEKVQSSTGHWLVTSYTYDQNGNKKTVTSPRGLVTTFHYDDLNRISSITYADGESKSFEYDAAGRKIAEVDENGNRTTYKYTPGGFLLETRRIMGEGSTPSDAVDIVTRTEFNFRGKPVAVTDPNGNRTETEYDGLDRPVLVRDAAGNVTRFHYGNNSGGSVFDSSGFKPTRVLDPRGFITQTSYDERYRPLRVEKEYSEGNTALDWWSRPLSAERAVTATDYDAVGNPTDTRVLRTADATAEADILHTHTEYDGLNRPHRTTVEPGEALEHSTRTDYTSTGLAWRTTAFENISGLNLEAEKEYDLAGRVIKEWTGTADNGIIHKGDPGPDRQPGYSARVTTIYDDDGNVTQVIDPLGRTTHYEYDDRNRRTRELLPEVDVFGEAEPISPATETTYDDAGNVVEVEDPRGTRTKTTYDRANRAVKVEAAFGNADLLAVTETTYDKNGNVLQVEDANDNRTRNTYDRLNRLVATSVNPLTGQPGWPITPASGDIVVANVYDAAGNLIAVADGAAVETWDEAWDEELRAWSIIDSEGRVGANSTGHITEFTYDGLNRKTATIWDAGTSVAKTELLHYDAVAVDYRTDAAGRATHYYYDQLFRLTTTSYAGSSSEDTTRYYKDGPGPLRAVWYGNGTDLRDVTYELDYLGRTIAETSGKARHEYVYDVAGNRLLARYHARPSGGTPGAELRSLVSEYDALNRLTKVHDTTTTGVNPFDTFIPNGTTDGTTAYEYDIGGLVRSKLLPNGQLTLTGYDALGRTRLMRTKNPGGTTISEASYQDAGPLKGYDKVGNVLRVIESSSNVPGRTVVNEYDHTYRLSTETTLTQGAPPVTVVTDYAYDSANNRTSKIVTGGSSPGTWAFTYGNPGAPGNYLNSNQLHSYTRTTDGADFLYEYDMHGNRAMSYKNGLQVDEYVYDRENRLTGFNSYDSTGRSDDYQYDYRSRRVLKDESGAATGSGPGTRVELSFSGGTSVQEYAGSATVPAAEHIRGSDWGGGVGGILYSRRGGAMSACAYNSRGDVVSRTDASGGVEWQASYEAFGTRTVNYGSTTEKQTANSKDEDLSGLLNEGMRYRDLETGVFLTRDPAGFVDGPNVYTYVRQNPWSAFDPLGLEEKEIGEVYLGVNHQTKEFYVGESERMAEGRMNDPGHEKMKQLRDKEGTLGYSRTVVADSENPSGLSERAQRMVVERELHEDTERKWGKLGYKSLNDKKMLLSDDKYNEAKRTTKPRLKAGETPKFFKSVESWHGFSRKMKPLDVRSGVVLGLTLGGTAAILGVASMYADEEEIGLKMMAWASAPWSHPQLEHELSEDIGGNLGTAGYVAVGSALKEARERMR